MHSIFTENILENVFNLFQFLVLKIMRVGSWNDGHGAFLVPNSGDFLWVKIVGTHCSIWMKTITL